MTMREQPARDRIDALLDEILTDAHGEDEQLWALLEAVTGELKLPMDVTVVEKPFSLVEVDYDGNMRRGITARCVDADGREHRVSLSAVRVAPDVFGHEYYTVYRRWLGLDSASEERAARPARKTAARDRELDLSKTVDLVLVRLTAQAARCRFLSKDEGVTLRAGTLGRFVPGQILTVQPQKHWQFNGHPYLSGEVDSARVDATALGLTPLTLTAVGEWDPARAYWGEEGEPREDWAEAIIARGRRQMFEMEQVLPGRDLEEPFTDPICESIDLREAGDLAGAEEILAGLLEIEMRCLDAHAHLGHLDFPFRPHWALLHYEVGVRIAELSLVEGFEGLLPWPVIENRPFLRCLHGFGLCLWRLERWEDAEQVFERLLWLDPADHMGIRFLLPDVRAREAWTEGEG